MPFKSQAQRSYLYANQPKLAQEFEAATPKGKKLPAYAKGSKKDTKDLTQKLGHAFNHIRH